MTPSQRAIAVAAVGVGEDTDMVRLHKRIADAAGMDPSELEEALLQLRGQFFLKLCTTPARDVSAEPQARNADIVFWYEKGDSWQD